MENKIPFETVEKIFHLYPKASFTYRKEEHRVDKNTVYPYPYCFDLLAKYASIPVTPLSLIADEDVAEVCKIYGRPIDHPNYQERLYQFKVDLATIGVPGYNNRHKVHVFDFLRSRRYALPAFGYTVYQLVQAGVFTLKKPDDEKKNP